LNEYHLAEPIMTGEDFLLWRRLLGWLPAARQSGHSQVDELTADIVPTSTSMASAQRPADK
jgi:hypothetical protein